jgi:hypothetical protein
MKSKGIYISIMYSIRLSQSFYWLIKNLLQLTEGELQSPETIIIIWLSKAEKIVQGDKVMGDIVGAID